MPAKRSTTEQNLEAATEALDGIEPELRQLAGLVMALRILGEAGDAIEPVAISAIARSTSSTLDDIDQAWRTAIAALRDA